MSGTPTIRCSARARSGLVSKLTSQFPSTTAAHMTTIHTGLPVGVHGVYEWFTLLPKLNRIIAPLLFSFAGDTVPDTLLASGVAAADVYPESDFYSSAPRRGCRRARRVPARDRREHARPGCCSATRPSTRSRDRRRRQRVGEALAETGRGYGFLYLPDVDAAMHRLGPDHPDVERLIDETLDRAPAEPAPRALPEGTLVLITADHGMAAIDPERSIYVNELWPEIVDHLAVGADGRPLAPAGSSRDLFLHTRPGSHEHVRATLQTLLEGRAEVRERRRARSSRASSAQPSASGSATASATSSPSLTLARPSTGTIRRASPSPTTANTAASRPPRWRSRSSRSSPEAPKVQAGIDDGAETPSLPRTATAAAEQWPAASSTGAGGDPSGKIWRRAPEREHVRIRTRIEGRRSSNGRCRHALRRRARAPLPGDRRRGRTRLARGLDRPAADDDRPAAAASRGRRR